MSTEIIQAIEILGREKGIEKEVVVAALEDAMAAAAKRVLRSQESFVGHFNPDTGEVEVFKIKTVVEEEELKNPLTEMTVEEAQQYIEGITPGTVIEFPLETTPYMGRIAAQQAKQVLTQKIREAERELIYHEYKDRIGTVINGLVKRIEKRNVIVDIGRTEALLPVSEQCRGERFNQGDRIRALIIDVRENTRGSQVVLSRAANDFVSRLFEMEVPEIYDETVVIRAVAREAGERTKIAVFSRDRDIDPIGACIGMRGMRVQAVTRELRGEKIDIIPFKEDLSDYVKAALAPATVTRVEIVDQEEKRMEVIVPEDQLSLTIGKKGQNVRLAGILVGWELDVKSEGAKKDEILAVMSSMMGQEGEAAQGDEAAQAALGGEEAAPEEEYFAVPDVPGVPVKVVETLARQGWADPETLLTVPDEDLLEIPGIGERILEHLRNWARNEVNREEE
ncbi:MAG: transcription termination factor NusA [Acidobacteriota bacterium]|jgi:transcription termination/antitermination protein NusA